MGEFANLREYVHHTLLAQLLQGQYPRNVPITEKQLIETYKVSKSPVRDALIELCSEGILQAMPRYGYMQVAYTPAEITNISDFRVCVEPHYLKRHWEKFTPERLNGLEELTRRHEELSPNCGPVEHWQMNSEFHLALAAVYQDQFFFQTLQVALQRHIFAFSQFYWDYWNRESIRLFPASHGEIINLIRSHRKEEAAAALAQDIATFHIPDERV